MPLDRVQRAAAQRDTVVDHDVVADLGRLADDHAHAVVDEEPPPEPGARVDLDAGGETNPLSQHPCRQTAAGHRPQGVGAAVGPDREQAGRGQGYLHPRARCGVALDRRVEIFEGPCGHGANETEHSRIGAT